MKSFDINDLMYSFQTHSMTEAEINIKLIAPNKCKVTLSCNGHSVEVETPDALTSKYTTFISRTVEKAVKTLSDKLNQSVNCERKNISTIEKFVENLQEKINE